MRAAVLQRFGAPLALTTVPDPAIADGDALIRVRATGVCGSDLKLAAGGLPGVTTQLIPGHEVAGELVMPAGGFAAGTRVALYMFTSCGPCSSCWRDQAPSAPVTGESVSNATVVSPS